MFTQQKIAGYYQSRWTNKRQTTVKITEILKIEIISINYVTIVKILLSNVLQKQNFSAKIGLLSHV